MIYPWLLGMGQAPTTTTTSFQPFQLLGGVWGQGLGGLSTPGEAARTGQDSSGCLGLSTGWVRVKGWCVVEFSNEIYLMTEPLDPIWSFLKSCFLSGSISQSLYHFAVLSCQRFIFTHGSTLMRFGARLAWRLQGHVWAINLNVRRIFLKIKIHHWKTLLPTILSPSASRRW